MWSPHRFARIAALRKHMLLDATIAGHGRQYTTTACITGEQDKLAVGCKAGLFLPSTLGEHLHLSRLEVLHRNVKSATAQMREYKGFAIRVVTRRITGTGGKGQALRRPAFNRHAINLRAAAAIRCEQQ